MTGHIQTDGKYWLLSTLCIGLEKGNTARQNEPKKFWSLSSLPIPRHCCVHQQSPFLSELPASLVTHCFILCGPRQPSPWLFSYLRLKRFQGLSRCCRHLLFPFPPPPELGVESRTSHVLGKHPSTQMCPQPYAYYFLFPLLLPPKSRQNTPSLDSAP